MCTNGTRNARRRARRAQDPHLREKERARCREYYRVHKEKIAERMRAYNEANKDKVQQWARQNDLQRKYGITTAEYDALLARQNGGCAICRRRPKENERLCVDHCHITGLIRGLLCHSCNIALGRFRDDQTSLIAALAYLCARPRDGPGSAAQRAMLAHAALPRARARKAVLKEIHLPGVRFDAAPCT
jgi:hypothetical protein